jgi:hypothetical protein
MKLYQPALFVSLGGTGCAIGAGLERRLREEICGLNGNSFRERPGMGGLLPYQLPSCIQFVYADTNLAELDRIPYRVVPGIQYASAAAMTACYSRNLVPRAESFPDLARNLRLLAMRETETWLPPPRQDEPRIVPLQRGAGQLPTVGRAALFESLLDGVAPLLDDIQTAVARLSKSGEELQLLGGRYPSGIDVFVSFSFAGGTGAGVFYDYLHLIGLALSNSSLRAKIWPLVVMPSAFEPGLGGGRDAELNAGQALLDLFRLVDEQNSSAVRLDLPRTHRARPIDSDDTAVYYPVTGRITMPPGTIQTGILFSRPAGAARGDMLQTIGSLVMSLIGTEITEEDRRSGVVPQSFADSFVNEAKVRQARADDGIGNRGVSTALAASMTVPVEELVGIVASRLLREAVGNLITPHPIDSTRSEIDEFLKNAGVYPVLQRNGVDFADPAPATGAHRVIAALNGRRDSMRIGIDALKAKLGREVPELLGRFDPVGAARVMLTRIDAFRLQWVVAGHPGLRNPIERLGVTGLLQHRRGAPPPPTGLGPNPPLLPELKDNFFRKARWSDDVVVAACNQQDAWYQWQTRVAWANAWDNDYLRWTRPLEQVQRDLAALTHALAEFARYDEEDFSRRSAELYRRRLGVSYLLPAGAGMEQFYLQVFERIRQQKAEEGELLKGNSSAADVVMALIGADTWAEVFEMSVEQSPAAAVSYLRERVKAGVKTFLCDTKPGEQPMLPRLHDLLAMASGYGRSVSSRPTVSHELLDEFRGKLAGLLPANFTPQGSGLLKVLVSYPASSSVPGIEKYLKSSINLPPGILSFRNTHTESISVVLFRTGMGLTEVGEVRDLLRLWVRAPAHPGRADRLPWRQRTGYRIGYLGTREEHRVEILHRILCALWNGKGAVEGAPISPARLTIKLAGGSMMRLPLTPLDQASSWGSLLRAYELWALDDGEIDRQFCAQLMRELPQGLDGPVRRPHALYLAVRDMASAQIKVLDKLIDKQKPNKDTLPTLMRAFWTETLPAALDLPFNVPETTVAGNLRALERVVGLTAPS